MNYEKAFREYEKSIVKAKWLEKTVVAGVYNEYNKEYMSILKATIEQHGVDFEMREFNNLFDCYCNNQMEISHVEFLRTMDKKYKTYIPYNKKFMEKLMDCLRGDGDE